MRQLHQEVIETMYSPHLTENNPTTTTAQLQLAPSTSRRAPPLQTSRVETQVPPPFIFHATTQRQQRALITDAIKKFLRI